MPKRVRRPAVVLPSRLRPAETIPSSTRGWIGSWTRTARSSTASPRLSYPRLSGCRRRAPRSPRPRSRLSSADPAPEPRECKAQGSADQPCPARRSPNAAQTHRPGISLNAAGWASYRARAAESLSARPGGRVAPHLTTWANNTPAITTSPAIAAAGFRGAGGAASSRVRRARARAPVRDKEARRRPSSAPGL